MEVFQSSLKLEVKMNIGLSSACFFPNVLTENSIKLISDIGFRSGEISGVISQLELETRLKKLEVQDVGPPEFNSAAMP